jgi:6,7-dimethyl-8-ribityllumazine synthase
MQVVCLKFKSQPMASVLPQDKSTPVPDGAGKRFGIVVSDYNRVITDALLTGCISTLTEHGVSEEEIHVSRVPGSFELPIGARLLMSQKRFDAVICLGCVIKGETKHDEYISQAVASGILQLSLMSSVPVIFGVLTPNTQEQAEARAGGKLGNKGIEAAETALHMAALKRETGSSKSKIGFS